MQNIDYSENLFRSIDTIVAERIKNLPYDATQLAEIVDDSSANAGMYKITSNHQLEEVAYADNPTYEKGDKVYILNTADNKRRFILGLYQRSDTGRTDRIMSILNGSIVSLKDLLQKQLHDGLDGLDGKIDGLNIYFGLTIDGILSIVEAKEEGLTTMIHQTADEIRMEAENTYEGLNSSFSITAGEIRSEVHDLTAGLESSISQTAGQIRTEVHDYYNELESSITQTAGQIRSEVHDYANGLESSITQTAGEIRSEVNDLKNELSTKISQTAYEIRSEAIDMKHGLQSTIEQTAEEINFRVEDVNQGLSIVSQTAAEIDSKVLDLEGNISDISQTATAITQRVTDMEGDFSLLEQTADHISSRVEAVEGNYSEIVQTADMISSRVESIEGNFSEIKQTADEISSRVETVEGNYSQISQTAAEISSRVEDVEGNYSEIVQNVNGITSTVEDLGKDLRSQIEQTATSITLGIYGDENNPGALNELKGTINGWAFKDENGRETLIKGDNIDTGTITLNKLTTNTQEGITFASNLKAGTTTINGNRITTGTITGDQINANNFSIITNDDDNKVTGVIEMYEGSTGKAATHGVGMRSNSYIVAVTNGGVRMSDYDSEHPTDSTRQIFIDSDSVDLKTIKNSITNHIWLGGDNDNIVLHNNKHNMHININKDSAYIAKSDANDNDEAYIALYSSYSEAATENDDEEKENTIKLGANHIHLEGTVYNKSGTVIHSDRNVKNNISYEMEKYENFYKLIKPVYYKLNEGTSDRYHIGYIYQDIESALLKSGLTTQDFAGVVKAHQNNEELFCGIRYEEFIALNTYMIQKTRKELEEKNNKIQQLENKIDELEQKLNLLLETLS